MAYRISQSDANHQGKSAAHAEPRPRPPAGLRRSQHRQTGPSSTREWRQHFLAVILESTNRPLVDALFARQKDLPRTGWTTDSESWLTPKCRHYVTGPTGRGKSGLACGLLLKELENGYRCQFVRAQDLFEEMYASLADRSTRQLLKRLARLDVLLVDEMGYLNLRPEQSNIFFKLMEERYRHHSTIITTNLDYDEWPNFLGSRPMVEALLSRLRHYCHTVHIKGPSLRDPQG